MPRTLAPLGRIARPARVVFAVALTGGAVAARPVAAADAGADARDASPADARMALAPPPRPEPAAPEPPWEPLFDGKTLKGWVVKGGAAKYTVKDGTIVGQTVPNTKNTFLSTERLFGDHVVELEFKVDAKLNSGIQIRGLSHPGYQDGRVHGYQIEIDPDVERGRLWTGGLYEEGRRGWLAEPRDSAAAKAGFKPDDWNHLRIEAIGDSIKTFLNQVPVVAALDPMELEGFLGLQVHQVGKREEPYYVSWRNIRVKDYGRRVWRPLLGSKALTGWRASGGGTWAVNDGVIVGTGTRDDRRAGVLFFETPLGDFAARAEVRLTGGNAGIYVAAAPAATAAGAQGLQIDLDAGPGATLGAGGLYETGGRGWLVRNPPATDKKNKAVQAWKPGEWTSVMVSSRGPELVTFIGGYRVATMKDLAREGGGLVGLEVAGGQDVRLEVRNFEVQSDTIPHPVPRYPIGWCIRAKGSAPDDARKAGFEYVELALQDVLDLPDAEFQQAVERFAKLGIPALTGYNFLPDDLKVIGPDVDRKRIEAHFARALPRVKKLGIKHIIFNSGPARRAPEGLAADKAWKELVAFSKRFARAAAAHDLSVLVIPLRSTDTNMVTKVGEGVELVKAVGARNFGLAIDYSFITIEKEDPQVLRKAGKHLRHVQIANPNGRGYPMAAAEADYQALFAALAAIGYQGGISVHARTDNFFADAPRALRFLRLSALGLAAPPGRRPR